MWAEGGETRVCYTHAHAHTHRVCCENTQPAWLSCDSKTHGAPQQYQLHPRHGRLNPQLPRVCGLLRAGPALLGREEGREHRAVKPRDSETHTQSPRPGTAAHLQGCWGSGVGYGQTARGLDGSCRCGRLRWAPSRPFSVVAAVTSADTLTTQLVQPHPEPRAQVYHRPTMRGQFFFSP